MRILSIVNIIFNLLFFLNSSAQQTFDLYTDKIPNSKPYDVKEGKGIWSLGHNYVTNVTHPTLTAFLPDPNKASGTAVIICPGGGYRVLGMSRAGYDIAKVFQKLEVAAFVLKYRLPSDKTMVNKSIGPLQNVQRAFQIVTENAENWNINTSKIGVAGFSAGGHLAASAATHYRNAYIDNEKQINLRPAFQILGFPVISFTDSLAHKGSRTNLLGEKPSSDLILKFSNELLVTNNTPPAFIFHSGDDRTVLVGNSLKYYEALYKNNVPAELMIYPSGGHGYGLNNPSTPSKWIEECTNWMIANGWLD
ncbi:MULTISPECIES: alpha/beta hydrolase [unclassified Leeuwenhoekiella]|uniref:alpha/beta hydrolase n=1 Tax=unclassified Leeuwenhoekiella TaxID=2615029 RepID=UPI000C5B940C|nr:MULTISPECIES: alpha/beta hydrolase [unclassified Leeuwenhoekiella]MAW94342.1 hypothetical protein [Leeuwenhoekiella sp.]MBA81018.1 hypothetical protein [Leeuwenhoekiella sp.]|tara:strand:- start:1936 stop:2856 length:921 start_codon:yes stop_codon:yes gene_type:complete